MNPQVSQFRGILEVRLFDVKTSSVIDIQILQILKHLENTRRDMVEFQWIPNSQHLHFAEEIDLVFVGIFGDLFTLLQSQQNIETFQFTIIVFGQRLCKVFLIPAKFAVDFYG
jgi:hypothetical protein